MPLKLHYRLPSLLIWSVVGLVNAQPIRTLPIKTAQELHTFFRWQPGKAPIISGHRGGTEQGFPENSLASFANTLRHTAAFFEVDPRLTKDSVIVLLHDATLDRTTTGTGKLSDYTWAEVKQLRLKDATGRVTNYRIPTLIEAINWARGKTVLNLDNKGVPLAMTAALLQRQRATAFVMLTVHTPEQARYYHQRNKDSMFSAFIRNRSELAAYLEAGIPAANMIAYIGPLLKPENKQLYALLHEQHMMGMVSATSSYDKQSIRDERAAAYQAIVQDGASIVESDRPIEVSQALRTTMHP